MSRLQQFSLQYYGLFSTHPLPPRRDFIILAYAGLRGALGLILAMELRHRVGSFEMSLKTAPTSIFRPEVLFVLFCCFTNGPKSSMTEVLLETSPFSRNYMWNCHPSIPSNFCVRLVTGRPGSFGAREILSYQLVFQLCSSNCSIILSFSRLSFILLPCFPILLPYFLFFFVLRILCLFYSLTDFWRPFLFQ